MTRTGVVFRPQSPIGRLRAVAEAADQAGIDELWLWEDCFLDSAVPAATAALAWTDRLTVGVGLLPVPLRNAAAATMEIATLARLFPGRVVPALGHGVLEWMGQVGARVESPMTLLREYTDAVRGLLDGERLTVEGRYVRLTDVALDDPVPEVPPLLIGARGPRTVALAGEVADGVLLDAVATPDAVRAARNTADAARAAAGLEGATRVVVFVETTPADARAAVERYAEAGADTVVLQAPEHTPDPEPLLDALRLRRS
ncbi:LLM class flavin-dependent oxidoreductase [Pseudonocardia oroxyli]|uniref:Flavin-dependent oxidoreductase, luciferase family (Includes alkanesulfonate monooxygenase SsuD and methylene tetrahydromethanopterin reductase) n=1 Tax=Pseudonocardia oroxyli TaxID=366584 RepID=A0A1G8DPJ8_PSEOR|nr:LLM class flavin-dependent oxidoreductase [Pseudonocardia oroxyli]SDH59606.1 Flavin-dependent oxidoreductase, luciferase family (includes alkanesulfonate monooxygenase SsuD and methylene tetrahydromethanopterin reductase) [Pseudonocardia oroxyli]